MSTAILARAFCCLFVWGCGIDCTRPRPGTIEVMLMKLCRLSPESTRCIVLRLQGFMAGYCNAARLYVVCAGGA